MDVAHHDLEDHSDDVTSVAWHDGGEILASGSLDQTVRIWTNLSTGRAPTAAGCIKHTAPLSCVAWGGGDISIGGANLCTSGADCSLRLWKVRRWEQALHCKFEGHSACVSSCAFSSNGKFVVSGSHDSTVRVWGWSEGARQLSCLEGHMGWVTSVACGREGDVAASASRDGSLRLWDLGGGGQGRQLLELWGHTLWVNDCAFVPGQSGLIVSAGHDKSIRLWDVRSGMEVACLKGHTAPVQGVSSASGVIASTSWDGSCIVWSLRQRTEVHCTPLSGAASRGTMGSGGLSLTRGLSCAMSDGGDDVAVGVSGGSLRMLQPSSAWEQSEEPAMAWGTEAGGQGGSEAEEWLVEALMQHMASAEVEERAIGCIDAGCHLFSLSSTGAGGGGMTRQGVHEAYGDAMLGLIEELRDRLEVPPASIASAVTALSRRRDEEVRRAVRLVDMIEDYALFAATCEARTATKEAEGHQFVIREKEAENERGMRELEEVKDAQLRDALQRFEEEAQTREVARIREEEERSADLKARLALLEAREAESQAVMEAMRKDKEKLAEELEEKKEAERQAEQARMAWEMHQKLQGDAIAAASDEERQRLAEKHDAEMRFLREQAEQERERRTEFETAMQEKLLELERQRAAVEMEKVKAVNELQMQLDVKEREEDVKRMQYDAMIKGKEAELAGLKAVSEAEREAVQKRVDAIKHDEEERRREHNLAMEARVAELEKQKMESSLAGHAEVARLRSEMEAREKAEKDRREGHELEFTKKLAAMERSRDAVDVERAQAVGELRRLTDELEAQRAAEAEHVRAKLQLEAAAKELEDRHQKALQEREELEQQLKSLQGVKDAQKRTSDEASDLKNELTRRQKELEKLAEEKSRIKAKKDQELRRKERTIDQMVSERRRNADQIEALKRENEQAREERERLSAALEAMQRDQAQRAVAELERHKQQQLRLEMLNLVVDDNQRISQAAPAKPEDKDALLADYEVRKQELIKMQEDERLRQERVLQNRIEKRGRKKKGLGDSGTLVIQDLP